MDQSEILTWLIQGDPAIGFQAARDLLNDPRPDLQARIATEGWGKAFLAARNPDGTWGTHFYQPRWTCTHYVLLELVGLGFPPDHPDMRRVITRVAETQTAGDGGMGHAVNCPKSDVCVTGMFLNYASYFAIDQPHLTSVIDFLLAMQVPDGGFNCHINTSGCHHSSLHSTTSVLEGFQTYLNAGYSHRRDEVAAVSKQSRDFILLHRFFKSDRTGNVISDKFLHLPYPPRWRYNILRGLDHFRAAGVPSHAAMDDALDALIARRGPDGRWPRMAAHPGKVFFTMEPARRSSRWNTLLALRVLKTYPRS